MKKYIKLFPILIITGFLMFFFLPSVKGFDDLNFQFQKDTLYTDLNVNNEFDNTFNLKNQSYYDLGNYPASYTFENDIIGVSPSDWIDDSETDCSAIIINNIANHNNVLELYDNHIVNLAIIYNTFNDRIVGTIEFWFRTTDTTKNSYFRLRENTVQRIVFRTDSNKLQYHDGAWQNITTITNNNWYHLQIDFNCTTDTLDIYVNKIKYIIGGSFSSGAIILNDIYIFTSGEHSEYYFYIDAICYSWIGILDFSNDIVGNEPIGWISDNIGDGTTIIKDSLDDRTNILELYDYDAYAMADISIDLDIGAKVSILTDWAKNDLSEGTIICGLYENDVNIIQIGIFDDDLRWKDTIGWKLVKADIILLNTFIIIKIVFDYDTDTFDVYIDAVLVGSNLAFIAEGNLEIDKIRFFTTQIESLPFYAYIDNIYIDDAPYSIGNNIFPLEVFTDYLEVDKYEFALESINSMRPFGSELLGTWQAINPGQDYVNIKQHVDDNNRVVEIYVPSGVFGIKKDNFTLTNEFIDITLGFDFTLLAGNQSYFLVVIKSSDTTTISGIQMFHNGSLGVFSGDPQSDIVWNGLTDSEFYEFTFRLNYELDLCFLDFWIDGIFEQSFTYSLIELGKSGLSYISITGDEDDGSGEMEIDYVGVYGDLISESYELGWSVLDLNLGSWNFETHNLVNVLANGYFHLGGVNGSYGYLVGESLGEINDFFQYSDINKLTNAYNSDFSLTNPLLIATVKGKNFTILTIDIEGVKLVQNTNEYSLVFTYEGVNIHDNYFFVDSSNNLRFIHNTNQDDVLEFIQAEFIIQNRTSTDTAISFRSDIDNNAYGFFRVKFTDTSLIIQMENILNTKRVLLESNKTIDSFVILISDTNKNYIDGITEGLITDIELFDIETSIASIVSLNLIEMIIPLIIILLPTLSISKLYGKFLIVPLFFMFSLILVITNLIPIWLFFVILFSSSLFIFFEKDREVVY